MSLKHSYLLLLTFALLGCENGSPKKVNVVQTIIEQVKADFAPDKRVAVFSIDVVENEKGYILKGESDMPKAVTFLKDRLLAENISFVDSIQLLPSVDLGDKTSGLIRISVANLRSNPKHSAELATQATLGTPVKILKKVGDWFYIQTPDKYLAWVDAGGITPMTARQMNDWKSADKIIYTKTYGHSYTGPNNDNVVSDLVAGNILSVLKYADKFYIVQYPDGRQAYVAKDESQEYDAWLNNLNPNPDALVETSKKLMGVPYLWGGTSTKGMDCSGYTKTVYFLNGMVIPRDASQQVHAGKPIDSTKNFENLQRGDLLFFGKKATDSTKEKVVHVGMWIGDNEFIHASEMVRISSMDESATNYDEFNKNRYLRTKRILKEDDDLLINLARTAVFKD
ncbi:C40 family peptidase [Costertonia aggregata]|uniref:C40 family peptidase n=1 Tax=Costertonia aggregata TaxID=343403 RepID=A0A7H9APH8_9FLAO|nr:SH3 domain-containing C40 family peptidase [Costertonia aggregata]QLG45371.1 C40 family peptidase [Costertonia aggregata]